MRALLIVTALVIAGCTSPGWRGEPGLPGQLAHSDDGTIAGVYRGPNGLVLTLYPPNGTYAVRRGCTVRAGGLIALGQDRYRLTDFQGGTEGCGPWRNGPELAPFDRDQLVLRRNGQRLTAGDNGPWTVLVRERNP